MNIKQKIKEIYMNKNFVFLVFFLMIFLILSKVNLKEGDDLYFYKLLQENTFFEFIKSRYFGWSGRISIESAIALLNFNLPIWRVINSVIATMMMFCISVYGNTKHMDIEHIRKQNILLCCIFFFIYPYVITSGVIWYTGSFNYLWSTAALMIAIIPFYYNIIDEKINSKAIYSICFICSVYASYMEQALAILICFGAIVLIYMKIFKIKINKYIYFQYLCTIVNGVIFILAPGNYSRIDVELIWYKNFNMLSFIDKMYQSINWTNNHLINSSNMIMLILVGLIFILVRKKHKEDKVTIYISSIPVIFYIINIIPFNYIMRNVATYQHGTAFLENINSSVFNIEMQLDKLLFNPTISNPSNLNTSITTLLPSVMSMSVILLIGILLLLCFNNKEHKFMAFIFYYAGLFSGYILCISPTIFASGSRIFFILNVLLLSIISMLIKELFIENYFKKYKFEKYILALIIFLAMIFALEYLLNFVYGILWL